ncbi:MAG: DNA endonuclease SmrA [Pseudomonadota bacterium]
MNEDDHDLDAFREAMSDVAPLAKGRQTTGGPREQTVGQQARREAAVGLTRDAVDPNFLTLGEVPAVEPLAYVEWKKDGVQHAVFSRLRQGGYPVQASLDLHRKTVKEARTEVFKFLNQASARDWRNLLIASGKGELSPTPGRLKSYLAFWLTEHPEVIAFCSAVRQQGGVGAMYVLVRKSQESKEENRERHGQKSDLDGPA